MWKSERKVAEILIRDEVITISYALSRITRILKWVFPFWKVPLYNCANLKFTLRLRKSARKNAEEILRKQERIKKQILRIDTFWSRGVLSAFSRSSHGDQSVFCGKI